MDSRLRRSIVPVVIGIVVATLVGAIAIPNLVLAHNRERQKRTMADMRTIATAMEARATDTNTYVIGTIGASSTSDEFATLTPISLDAVVRALTPKYIRTFPRHDGWGNEFEIRVGAKSYAIRTAGSDGRREAQIRLNHLVTKFEEDIVFSNGNFIQYPEGSCVQ